MKLVLSRQTETPNSTSGEITIEGVHACFTLERPGPQFPATVHRIPAGTYPISIYDSPHFGRPMPLLTVPGHEGIEIHWGNYPAESRGCILVGVERSADAIWHTKDMFSSLFITIQSAVEGGGCEIEILDPQPEMDVDLATQT